jgi:hypothetical protein
MDMQNQTKLKWVLKEIPNNAIVTIKWLENNGISKALKDVYKKSGWLKPLGTGAFVKLNDSYNLDSGLYAVQEQLGLSIHIGAASALSQKHNIRHNLDFGRKTQLFGARGEKPPKWFKVLFEDNYQLNLTTFLPKDMGLMEFDNGNFKTKVSSIERSILEMIYLAPDKTSIKEIYQLMELLVNLRPKDVQLLLENCSSIKVKRLFLYLAEKVNHSWVKRIELGKIDLGKGVREIVRSGGVWDKKYNIIINDIEAI